MGPLPGFTGLGGLISNSRARDTCRRGIATSRPPTDTRTAYPSLSSLVPRIGPSKDVLPSSGPRVLIFDQAREAIEVLPGLHRPVEAGGAHLEVVGHLDAVVLVEEPGDRVAHRRALVGGDGRVRLIGLHPGVAARVVDVETKNTAARTLEPFQGHELDAMPGGDGLDLSAELFNIDAHALSVHPLRGPNGRATSAAC